MNQEIFDILRSEIKPALGCTGPIGICYCAAQAYDAIGGEIRCIDAEIDWGLCSKIDDVAFPGTEMLGVDMATPARDWKCCMPSRRKRKGRPVRPPGWYGFIPSGTERISACMLKSP